MTQFCEKKIRKIFMDKYECSLCGYIYDPGIGDPDASIEPGKAFEDTFLMIKPARHVGVVKKSELCF